MDLPKLDDIAGPLGALIALLWSKESGLRRNLASVAAGATMAYMFGADVTAWLNTGEGHKISEFAVKGFIGLFGVATVNKIINTIYAMDINRMFERWLGIPGKTGASGHGKLDKHKEKK